MHAKIKRIVLTALIAALVYVATSIITIPSPLKGYLNLGDCIVLLAGWMLPVGYGLLAAGLGSALADVGAGYMIYAPATFVIKALMAVTVYLCYKLLSKRLGKLPAQIIGAVLAEILMVLGYYVFEGFLYGFIPAAVNIPANAVQGAAGIIIGLLLIKALEKAKLTDKV